MNERSLIFDSKRFLHKVGSKRTTRLYRKNQDIYSQGDSAGAMFYIHAGMVKLTVMPRGGKRAIVAILGQDDFFGEGCLASRSRRISSATAVQPSTIVRVRKATILAVIHEDPTFAKLVISHLVTRIGRVEEDLVHHISNSSEKRLARLLLLLTNFGQKAELRRPVLTVNQATLAEMVGTTRSRVSFFMNRFRKRGLIHYNGGLQVRRSLLTFLLRG